MSWYRKAADAGNANAQFYLGFFYIAARGVTRDYGEGVKWFRKAAEQGFAPTMAEAQRNDTLVSCVGLTQSAVYLGTVVAFCFWVYSAHANLRWLRVSGLEYTPGWAVGWFFVPIMLLFRPCQVMFEIWKASDPRIPSDNPIAC